MPPRYAYWTIIVDDQATAFRAGSLEDIMPTFNRLKEKQPSAKLMWFQSGKLWPSRVDAREAMQVRGDRGRDRDPRQARSSSDDRRDGPAKPAWRPKGDVGSGYRTSGKPSRPEWKPKSTAAASFSRSDKPGRPEWKPRSAAAAGFSRSDKPSRPEWKPKSSVAPGFSRSNKPGRPEWKPKASSGDAAPSRDAPEGKRKWIPKAEYKKLTGTEAPRDQKWRPGGEHKDPRQKYKDAKKAKWTRVKQTIRARSVKPRGKP